MGMDNIVYIINSATILGKIVKHTILDIILSPEGGAILRGRGGQEVGGK